MNLFTKLLLGLVIAIATATITAVLSGGDAFNLPLIVACCVTALACCALMSVGSSAPTPSAAAAHTGTSPADGDRDSGTVKWFNVSKGFGFITMDNGEEIFVHFRSIRGEGRRALRDGQQVNFIVAQSDKGPQAEDVVAEN